MIRKNALLCSLIGIRETSKEIFDAFMISYRPEQETCPRCGEKGKCSVHAYYGRNLVDFVDGFPIRQNITVLRVVCGCGYTHAVLPDIVIPYCSYSLLFVLRVLAEYFRGSFTVEKLCGRFLITASQLYKWLDLWKTQKTKWLSILGFEKMPDHCFLCSILRMSSYSDFAFRFVRLFSVSFLQFHENPAAYQQEVFDG